MSICFRCACGSHLMAPDDGASRRARCPRCAAIMIVPPASAVAAEPALAAEMLTDAALDPANPGVLGYQGSGLTAVPTSIRAMDILRRTRPWVLFMSIMIFISAGLMLLASAAMAIMTVAGPGPEKPPGVLALVYFVMAVISIAPGIYLMRYASNIRRLLRAPDAFGLESALDAQRAFWKFVGIYTIVVMGLYCLMIPVVVALSVLRR